AASASRPATSPARERAAAHAGASPAAAGRRSGAEAITGSGGPREARLRQPGLALVLDTERADARALRLRHREIGGDGVEHAVEPHRLPGLDAERHDVLDLEVDRVADADAVAQPVVLHLDPRTLNSEHLAHERGEPAHRSSELSAEDLHELLALLLGRLLVDEDAEP